MAKTTALMAMNQARTAPVKSLFVSALPGIVLLSFAFGGGFYSGASWTVWGLWLLVALAVLLKGPETLSGMGLGGPLRWFMGALVVAVAVSWASSAFPRAGSSGLLLLPLVLQIGGLMTLQTSASVRRASGGILLATLVVSGWSLVDPFLEDSAELSLQAAMPLGHHNLLALWLVLLIPAAWAAAWTHTVQLTLHAVLTRAALGTALVALLATRSLSGWVGLLVGLLALFQAKRWVMPPELNAAPAKVGARAILVLIAVVFVAASVPRWSSVLSGRDASSQARARYSAAAIDGFLEEPMLGWGPGTSAWTLHESFRPSLGVNPAGEILSDPHSLPLDLLYELGVGGGIALALWMGVLLRGARLLRALGEVAEAERSLVADRAGAWAGLMGFSAAALAAGWFDVVALVPAILLAVGRLLRPAVAEELESEVNEPAPAAGGALPRVVLACYLVFAGWWLVPRAQAHFSYDVARSTPATSSEHLARAAHLDPNMPLYAARQALVADTGPSEPSPARTPPIPALALLRARTDGGMPALREACRLDALSAWGPFLLARSENGLRATALWARAIASQPELLAASELKGDPLRRIGEHLEHDDRLPVGWRAALVDQIQTLQNTEIWSGEPLLAQLQMDASPSTSVSLFAFRRLPWPVVVAEIELDAGALATVTLPSLASVAAQVRPSFYSPDLCAGPAGLPKS